MNAFLNPNSINFVPFFLAVQSKPIHPSNAPLWIRTIARFFVRPDDPAALRYMENKYQEDWD